VWAHRGVRTNTHKLVHYYGDGLGQAGTGDEQRSEEWELFDLVADPFELRSLHDDPVHAPALAVLRRELRRLAREVGDLEPEVDPRRSPVPAEEES
jgi:choline-sulfatase